MLMERHITEEAVMHEMDANEEQLISMDQESYRNEGSTLVNVSHLVIPAELALIIQALTGIIILISYNVLMLLLSRVEE